MSATSAPSHQPPPDWARPGPPGVVIAAAVVTWVGATGTAAITLLLGLSVLWLAAPLFDQFNPGWDNPRWLVLETVGIVLALSLAADLAAIFLVRGHRWARWVLIGLSIVAAAGGLVSAYYVAPLAVTVAAVVVVVLLALPSSRAWYVAR